MYRVLCVTLTTDNQLTCKCKNLPALFKRHVKKKKSPFQNDFVHTTTSNQSTEMTDRPKADMYSIISSTFKLFCAKKVCKRRIK